MSDITLEKIDMIRERVHCTYLQAKDALNTTDGNVVEAVVLIEKQSNSENETSSVDDIMNTVKNFIKDGNVRRIKVKTGEKQIADIPLSAGILATGTIALVLSAPILIALLGLTAAGTLTDTITIEVTKNDGSIQVINKILKNSVDNVKNTVIDPNSKEKFENATQTVKDSAKKITNNMMSWVDDIKGKKPETKTYTVDFEDDND